MLGLTIVGLIDTLTIGGVIIGGIVSILFLYWRVIHLSARLEDTRTLAADALDAHTTALTRFSERLGAMEYPRYMGTAIGDDRPVESPEASDLTWDVHYQRPRTADNCDQSEMGPLSMSEWDAHDRAVVEALKTPLPNPSNSPFFRQDASSTDGFSPFEK